MNNPIYQLSIPCLFGLESILSFEVKKIGAENVQTFDGKVNFSGDISTIARANLWVRTGERVGIVVGSFRAETFSELFDQTNALPWEKFLQKDDAFPVKGWSLKSTLHSVPSCQSIMKKAIVRRLESAYHQEFFAESGPIHQIRFSILKDQVTVMLDTTGPALHKRGYRETGNLAPIRETLAAGIVDLARVRSNATLYDPMCGSGTLLIEAAMRARNIAPGLQRSFDFEKWHISDPAVWQQERKHAVDSIDKTVSFRAYGSDIDGGALKQAEYNARLAGVSDCVTFLKSDVADFSPAAPCTVLCNPPYGERLLDEDEAHQLYRTMGKAMPPISGVSYYIIGPHEDFESAFGRRADKKRKLYNGMIPCHLYMYFRS